VLAAELGPRHIRVNVIAPGGVKTQGTHAAGVIGSDFEKSMIAKKPRSAGSVSRRISHGSRSSSPPTIPAGSPASASSPPAAISDAGSQRSETVIASEAKQSGSVVRILDCFVAALRGSSH
jgi:NAD(P)-dependent dehydrogenase (short-subunit alcohol dehydrogenase family)